MSTWQIVLLVILAVLIAAVVALYFLGRKAQKKIKDSGLPQAVINQTPKLMRGSKLPIVKAKVGPQIMSLVSDDKIFDSIPVKKEVKAVVSGIYITDVKGLRGKVQVEQKKKGFFRRTLEKVQEKAGAKPLK